MTEEERRLRDPATGADWKQWGSYLSQRSWGTVREDYSPDGQAWTYFPHDHARSRAYRWNEDGLLGICDRDQLLCFSLALWNGKDPILKERPFGLSNPEGNHGEDVKEYYYFLDATPTHSYMKALYKYPQAAFPYAQLIESNRRSRDLPEFELLDTGIFNDNRYFDVQIEYAKAAPTDLLIRLTLTNRGPDPAPLWLLPTLWFRNKWSWDRKTPKPSMHLDPNGTVRCDHADLGPYSLTFESLPKPEIIFTENETNFSRLFQTPNPSPYVKDAFHHYLIDGSRSAINPAQTGTKAAIVYPLTIPPGQSTTLRLRLSAGAAPTAIDSTFDPLFETRRAEADAFYQSISPAALPDDHKNIQRQAFAGLLWNKQFYNYDVRQWLNGDPAFPPPPDSRWDGRNHDWLHIANNTVLSMPDTWEYPWYAAWDLAFHTISLALIDPDFAKHQLILLLREWYMHPSGQLPAYEWNFSDVNPPVHAWAALRVFRIERHARGKGDYLFLERVFQKLLINFTWWINRKDKDGRNIFQGGFLGLDNIGLFDRDARLPNGAYLDQSDGTAWMAMFCLNMLAIAIELAREDPAYEDLATKFLEHFFYIAHAMNNRPAASRDDGIDLWDDDDQFYYDVIHKSDGQHLFVPVRSMVGLIPLLAVETIEADTLQRLPDFAQRLDWFLTNRPELCATVASVARTGQSDRRLFSIVNSDRLRAILTRMLDPEEFLSPHGLRSVSRYHKDHPVHLDLDGVTYTLTYEPAESTTNLFGGNSNWRGPVWFPPNYLIIEALQKFDFYYGDSFKIDCPTRSGDQKNLWDVARYLSNSLVTLFTRDPAGNRPLFGTVDKFQHDPHWRDLLTFPEYFHGDTGFGLGASHQTGWTALVAKLIQQRASKRATPRTKS
ncbi:MAG TPA: hypothetical protein VFE58_06345 [Tepidisphaeraceae bacterium]|jgi:hypothetical protein|nr:hypothetical protein [Tepidisphaeraceae bacterium]